MTPARPDGSSNRKPPRSTQPTQLKSQYGHVRWIALALAIVLLLCSLVLRFQPTLLPKGSELASDIVGKVGIVTLCVWFAWPALETIGRAPGGFALVFGGIFTIILFIYQRKTILITGPILIVAIGMAYAVTWLRKFKQ